MKIRTLRPMCEPRLTRPLRTSLGSPPPVRPLSCSGTVASPRFHRQADLTAASGSPASSGPHPGRIICLEKPVLVTPSNEVYTSNPLHPDPPSPGVSLLLSPAFYILPPFANASSTRTQILTKSLVAVTPATAHGKVREGSSLRVKGEESCIFGRSRV